MRLQAWNKEAKVLHEHAYAGTRLLRVRQLEQMLEASSPAEMEVGVMARKDVHVVPAQGTWKVESAEGMREFRTQQEAERFGRDVARKEEAELFIHGRDGQIRERDSFGNDPRDTPG